MGVSYGEPQYLVIALLGVGFIIYACFLLALKRVISVFFKKPTAQILETIKKRGDVAQDTIDTEYVTQATIDTEKSKPKVDQKSDVKKVFTKVHTIHVQTF